LQKTEALTPALWCFSNSLEACSSADCLGKLKSRIRSFNSVWLCSETNQHPVCHILYPYAVSPPEFLSARYHRERTHFITSVLASHSISFLTLMKIVVSTIETLASF